VIGRYVAPAGAPIRAADLAAFIRTVPELGAAEERLKSVISDRTGRRHCALTCTGRAGLTVLLSALSSLAGRDRDEVIVPSYTCYSVAASVVRAGLRLRIVDVDARSLDFNIEKLGNADYRRVLAIVAPSLYGLPACLPEIAALARDQHAFLIDDAAQSFGAAVGSRPAGGWGDAGLLSFDKGKNISAIDGGAIVSDSDDISRAVASRVGKLRRPPVAATAVHLVKLGVYAGFLAPALYWIPNALPGLGLGQTRYRSDFAVERPSRLLTALAATMVRRLDEFQAFRAAVAARFGEAFRDTPSMTIPRPAAGARPAYLRFPLLVDDPDVRDQILVACQSSGIGATGSYPRSIADLPELRHAYVDGVDARMGRYVAERIVTLPTHPYVAERDIAGTIQAVLGCLNSGPRTAAHRVIAG